MICLEALILSLSLREHLNIIDMINIDKLLKDKGLSKTDIARRMNLSRESLYRIISGNPTLENIQKLASALGVPITELFEQPKSDVINCPHCGGKIKMSKE
jgi:transcriptional regulator with XRE-family HTH domain